MQLIVQTKTKTVHAARTNDVIGTFKVCTPGAQTRFSRNLELTEGTADEVTCIRCKRAMSNIALKPSDF